MALSSRATRPSRPPSRDDTLETLRLRVERTSSRLAGSEIPPSRVRYCLQISDLTHGPSAGHALVASNLLVYQTRLEMDETFFVGEREDTLRRVNGEWKVAARTIIIDRSVVLTHGGALKVLAAAIAKAEFMAAPQCIAVVGAGGHLLAFVRMDCAKFLSIDTTIRKAITAASGRRATGHVSADAETRLAIATRGKLINLEGGVPIVVDGHLIGAAGVGSGTGEQDLEVARAGAAVITAAPS